MQIISIMTAASIGVWLFYVQHQFEDAYWQTHQEWNFVDAAIKGSSFYQLPKFLHVATANIGFHHIHHLNPTIPSYHLEKCHYADPFFDTAKKITLRESLSTIKLKLWDVQAGAMVPFPQRA